RTADAHHAYLDQVRECASATGAAEEFVEKVVARFAHARARGVTIAEAPPAPAHVTSEAIMLGKQKGQMSLADAQLWTGKSKQLVDPGSYHDRFAKVRPTILKDEDFAHWFDPKIGRPSVPPSVVAGAFLLALRE